MSAGAKSKEVFIHSRCSRMFRKRPNRKSGAPATRKLTFTALHELKTLPAQLAVLEKTIAALHAKLSDAALYERDPEAFAAASASLVEAQSALASGEDRWLELEMLREELERS